VPFGSVTLRPGINVEKTPTLLEAGYAQSQLIRFRDGLAQKIGGWVRFFASNAPGVPRDLHAWADLNSVNHLLVGTTTSLGAITGSIFQDITPQIFQSDFTPNFSTVINTPTVTIIDPNISNVTINDSVLFNTPISVGGLILSGIYPIASIVGTHSYTIIAKKNATSTATNVGQVPGFTTTNTSSIVSVSFAGHGTSVGATVVFPVATIANGVTIKGAYTVSSVIDAFNFTITVSTTGNFSGGFFMNGGNAELLYYIALGPPPVGVGFGLGGFGLGGFGAGVVPPNQIGPEITATDYTSDNWGEIVLACPENGGVYYWDPTGGFTNASLIASGPVFNRGIFVSTSQQILIAFGSTIDETISGGIGIQQDPMLVAWCDVGNFFQWQALTTTQAGNFRIPIGSRCVGGMAVANQNLIWTDLDLWAMNYIGYPETYGFNKIGAGAGLASSHAAQQLRGGVYWMGPSNFYSYTGGGVQVIPCPVWDFVFQNLNTAFIHNVRAMPNTPFNEVGWAFPSKASASGENDSYVKMNITEPGAPWDYGLLPRSAWIDQTVLGPPIGAIPAGTIYQHEIGNDADGQPIVWSWTTGYFRLAEGEIYAFIDRIQPDFKFGTSGGAQTATIQMSFNVTNYSGDPPTVYGPYTVTQATEFITTRFRGGLMSITVSGSDLGSFSRLGYVRYRWREDGRR
jgi:hypothetical protein